MHFTSLGAFAGHLMGVADRLARREHEMLDFAGRYITRASRRKFGVYQRSSGPFPAWAPLAASTREDRVSKGFSENEPLLRSGATQSSFGYVVEGSEAVVIGSTSKLIVFHEFGTSRMPPRPVLGPAALESMDYLTGRLGGILYSGFFNYTPGLALDRPIHESLGYEGDSYE